jgi:hypothetical protein
MAHRLESPVEPLFDPSCFTHPIPEVVKFGAADFASAQDFDAGNPGGMEQENPFYTDPLENFADGDGFVETPIAFGNDSPFVGLNPLFATLNDFDPNFNGVANMNGGQIVFDKLCFDGIDYRLGVHGDSKNSQFPIITDLSFFAKGQSRIFWAFGGWTGELLMMPLIGFGYTDPIPCFQLLDGAPLGDRQPGKPMSMSLFWLL